MFIGGKCFDIISIDSNQTVIFILYFSDHADVCGYLVFVSSIKSGKKCQYFDIQIATETKEVRVVCFDADIHEQLQTWDGGIFLKNLVCSKEDYLFLDSSSFVPAEPKFALKRFERPITPLKEIANVNLYSRISIKIKVHELQPLQEVNGLKFLTGTAVDQNGDSRQLTLYNEHCTKVLVNKCYLITEITVTKYLSRRVLKTSEQSLFKLVPDFIVVTENVPSSKATKSGTVIHVDSSSLSSKLLCPKCKSEASEDETLLICNHCDTISSVKNAVYKAAVRFTIALDKSSSLNLVCAHSKLVELTSIPISNRVAFLKQIINMNVLVTYCVLTSTVSNITRVPDLETSPSTPPQEDSEDEE